MAEVTGAFWKYDPKIKKYWGEFDTDAELTFPFSLDQWIEDETASIFSITPRGYGIFSLEQTIVDRKFLLKIKLAEDAEYVKGIKYPFTVKFKDTTGETDEQTFYLLLLDK